MVYLCGAVVVALSVCPVTIADAAPAAGLDPWASSEFEQLTHNHNVASHSGVACSSKNQSTCGSSMSSGARKDGRDERFIDPVARKDARSPNTHAILHTKRALSVANEYAFAPTHGIPDSSRK